MKLSDLTSFHIEINESNIVDAVEIIKTMQTPGWAILKKYWDHGREIVIEQGKIRAMSETEQCSKLRWAVLEGYDAQLAIPLQIKQQADSFIQVNNGGTDGNEQERETE